LLRRELMLIKGQIASPKLKPLWLVCWL